MKKVLKNLGTFAPVLVLIVVVLLLKVFKTFNVDTVIDYLTSNWIVISVAFTLGACWAKFMMSRKKKSYEDD